MSDQCTCDICNGQRAWITKSAQMLYMNLVRDLDGNIMSVPGFSRFFLTDKLAENHGVSMTDGLLLLTGLEHAGVASFPRTECEKYAPPGGAFVHHPDLAHVWVFSGPLLPGK